LQIKSGVLGRSGHRTMDVNGDGRDDLFAFINNSWRVMYSTGASYAIGDLLGPGVNNEPIDANADACTDVLLGTNPRRLLVSKCRLESGSGLIETQTVLPAGMLYEPMIFDWDGDGVEDVLYADLNTSLIQWSRAVNGVLRTPQPTTVVAPPLSFGTVLTDLDGNGRMDVAYTDPNGTGVFNFRRNVGGYPELMKQLTDGYGNLVTFDYQPQVSTGCYTHNSIAPPLGSGLRNRMGGIYVACRLGLPDGRGSQYTLSYTYGDGKVSVRGRGFAGFGTRSARDSRTGVYTQETYRQDFPFAGMIAAASTYQASGTAINSVTNTPAAKYFGTGVRQTAFAYLASSVVDAYEVGGTLNGALITRETTSMAVDDYGNATSVTATAQDKDAGSPQAETSYSRQTVNTILNDTANWCLGRASQTTLTDTLGATSRTRKQAATIDYAMSGDPDGDRAGCRAAEGRHRHHLRYRRLRQSNCHHRARLRAERGSLAGAHYALQLWNPLSAARGDHRSIGAGEYHRVSL
jgi:hypothetical protein